MTTNDTPDGEDVTRETWTDWRATAKTAMLFVAVLLFVTRCAGWW